MSTDGIGAADTLAPTALHCPNCGSFDFVEVVFERRTATARFYDRQTYLSVGEPLAHDVDEVHIYCDGCDWLVDPQAPRD